MIQMLSQQRLRMGALDRKMEMIRNRSIQLGALTLAAAVMFSSTACGSQSSGNSVEEGGRSNFPVTVEHAYGAETIDEKPERILDLTYGSALEPFLALDEAPISANAIGDLEKNVPWLADRVTWPMVEGLRDNLENVASLDPDLIIINEVDRTDWERLENVAPTLSIKDESDRSTWHTFLPIVAAITGNSDKVDEIESSYADQVNQFKEDFVGADELTYNSAALTRGFVYSRNNVLQDLGLKLEEGQQSKEGSISDENISLLRGDMLIIFDPMNQRSEIEGRVDFESLPAVKNGALIWQDKPMGFALSTAPGPLSLAWLVDKIAPQVRAAIEANN